MKDWIETNSPLWSYWAPLLSPISKHLDQYIIHGYRIWSPVERFFYGLPNTETELMKVCRSRFRNDIVKLSVQIAEPSVMKIEKDVISTFTDQLGVIGNTKTNMS